jgi:hypothetical protein
VFPKYYLLEDGARPLLPGRPLLDAHGSGAVLLQSVVHLRIRVVGLVEALAPAARRVGVGLPGELLVSILQLISGRNYWSYKNINDEFYNFLVPLNL